MLEFSTRFDNVPIVRSETHAAGSFTGFETRAHSLQSDAPKSQARLTSPVDYNIFDIIRTREPRVVMPARLQLWLQLPPSSPVRVQRCWQAGTSRARAPIQSPRNNSTPQTRGRQVAGLFVLEAAKRGPAGPQPFVPLTRASPRLEVLVRRAGSGSEPRIRSDPRRGTICNAQFCALGADSLAAAPRCRAQTGTCDHIYTLLSG